MDSLLEELLLGFGVLLGVLLERLVLDQSHIGSKQQISSRLRQSETES